MASYNVSSFKVINDGEFKLLVKNTCRNDSHGVHWSTWANGNSKEDLLNDVIKRMGLFTESCLYNKSALSKKMKDIIESKKDNFKYIFDLYETEEFKNAFLEMIKGKIKRCDYNYEFKYR